MFCGHCGTENTEASNFCKSCGEPLQATLSDDSARTEESPFASLDTASSEDEAFSKKNLHNEGEDASPFAAVDTPSKTNQSRETGKDLAGMVSENHSNDNDDPFQTIETSGIPSNANDALNQPARIAEPCPTFAKDLPEWDLVPPNILVMRR